METFWFAVVSVMLALYVVLDGFDFGVGIVQHWVTRDESERRTVLAAIGPYWDGNEVWLIAGGGVLFFAFPHAFAAAFSGFYLPFNIVLWLLVLRGISIELRSHVDNHLWRDFWSGGFAFASALLALVLGTALGNVIRGVPVDGTGYFDMPLFTNFLTGAHPGVFDWYTLLVGIFAVILLAAHGALFLAWKTTGNIHERSRATARRAWNIMVPFWVIVTAATASLRWPLFEHLLTHLWIFPLAILPVAALFAVFRFQDLGQDRNAFLASSVFIATILAATMAGNYPLLLRSTLDATDDLTAQNAAAGAFGLRVGVVWWSIGIVLAIAYFTYLFWMFAGKIETPKAEEHH